MSIDEALDEIRRAAGSQFDPGLARLFITSVEFDERPPMRPAPIATDNALVPRLKILP